MPSVLTVVAAPDRAIDRHPTSAAIVAAPGSDLQVVAVGSPAPKFQWQKSSDGGATFADIVGATSSSYTLSATTLADNGLQFRVIVGNSAGTITSASGSS